MRKKPIFGALGAICVSAVVAGCGTRTELQPPPGAQLPVAPYGASERPDADMLLTPGPQAAPERQIELRRRSQEREDDPFDVPPE